MQFKLGELTFDYPSLSPAWTAGPLIFVKVDHFWLCLSRERRGYRTSEYAESQSKMVEYHLLSQGVGVVVGSPQRPNVGRVD